MVGEVKQALLDGDTKNYDMERGFSRHPIDESQDKGIIVKLGMQVRDIVMKVVSLRRQILSFQCIINHIRMLLWDRDQRYSS